MILEDGAGDTWTYSDTSDYEPSALPAADVLVARVTHGRRAVKVREVFDDLQRSGIQWFWCVVSGSGASHWFVIEARPHGYAGTAYEEIEGEWVQSPTVGHRIDYAADVVTLRIPRALLGRPASVRVRLWNELGVGEGIFFMDTPSSAGHRPRDSRPISVAGSSGR